jgi:predicted ATPase/DNA-binding CsgD family transcriptional regulator/DNA-binding XRE family transcriptional regulator
MLADEARGTMATTDGVGPFGTLLQRSRVAAGLSQEELAERAGLSKRGISDLERGQRRSPHPATVRRLAEALNVDCAERAAWVSSAAVAAHTSGAAPRISGRHNLPLQLTSFIGRDRELEDLPKRLATTRLLTVTGPGGIGKTRLALRIARSRVATFPDGVWLVELAPLSDPALVVRTVATVLGVGEQAGESILNTLVARLEPRHLLLVLDNCEHLLQACAVLVDAVLRACPKLRILATSREPLSVNGEVAWRVPSLPVPEPRPAASLADVQQNAAVRLFVERAGAAQRRFALTARNAAAVAQICRRLDGLPLALELAAARVETLTAEQLVARLDQRFRLLTGGSRTALPKQQTLSATLDWSYELLSESERRLFERLAVFAGGWTLEAAEAVGSDDELAGEEVLELLARLVHKSLVVAEEQADGTARYRLLETMREYAGQRLAARGPAEVAAARGRHAVFYSAVASQLGPVAQTTPSAASGDAPIEVVRDRIEAGYDNLRAALGWWLAQGRPVEGLGLAHALGFFWLARGLYAEGRRWLEAMLALADRTVRCASATAVPSRLRADALSWLGGMASAQGSYTQARASYEASVALWRELGDLVMLADDLALLGLNRWLAEDAAAAIAALEESLRLCRANAIPGETATTLRHLGMIARWQGQYERAVALLREAVAEAEAQPAGAYHRAVNVTFGLAELGRAAYLQGDSPQAETALRNAVGVIRETGLAGECLTNCLDWVGALEGAHGRPVRATQLFGAADAQWRASGAARYATDRPAYERDLATVRAALDEEAFAAAWAEGQGLSWDDAVALAENALAKETVPPVPLPAGHPASGPLTPRQREVAALIAQGLTNRQIGERLVVTEAAAAKHVEHILNKLGIGTRAQIAAWAVEHGLVTTRTD